MLSSAPRTPNGNRVVNLSCIIIKFVKFGLSKLVNIIKPMMVRAKKHYIFIIISSALHTWCNVCNFHISLKATDKALLVRLNYFTQMAKTIKFAWRCYAPPCLTRTRLSAILSVLVALPLRHCKQLMAKSTGESNFGSFYTDKTKCSSFPCTNKGAIVTSPTLKYGRSYLKRLFANLTNSYYSYFFHTLTIPQEQI